MDALAQLALLTKAKLVFESQDTYLSFPALTPISYTADQLRFNNLAANLNTMSEFARFTNTAPKGTLFQPDEQAYLWDAYADIFKKAELAKGTLTPAEESAYRQAVSFLYTGDPGSPESPALLAYKERRDAYINAKEAYKTTQLSAEFSSDPAEKQHWLTVDEPRLRQEVDEADADWTTNGFKAQVEEAQRIELAMGAKSPLMKWQEWAHSFNRDLDMMTDANSQSFAITGFAPSDAFNQGNWPTFNLSAADMTQLIGQAPPELKNVLGSSTGASSIDHMSFEFRSVGVVRPWLRSAVFDARFWRLPGSEPPISDGNTPAQGQCPAIVTAVIFARNIVVTAKGGSPAPVKTLPVFQLQNAAVRQTLMTNMSKTVMVARAPVTPAPQKPPIAMVATRLSASTFSGKAAMASRSAAMVRPQAATFAAAGAIKVSPVRADILRAQVPPVAQPQPRPPQPPPRPPATTVDSTISILAFICKRLRRCPDPDLSLNW